MESSSKRRGGSTLGNLKGGDRGAGKCEEDDKYGNEHGAEVR